MTLQRGFLRAKSHERDEEDDDEDDDSDTITELSFSRSPTSSLGRSSTGSIPWAEDAVKQNQQEWERIERMFYGEEELPKDSKIREEFVEWMTAFPHLRIVGNGITVQESPLSKCSDQFHEEIFAIDPPSASRIRSSKSGKVVKQVKECELQLVPNDIERYLHISSGHVMRNNHRNAKDLFKNNDSLVSFVDTVEKPLKQKSSNNLVIPTSNQSFGILISNNYNYLTESNLANSRNGSAQSVTRFNNSIMHKKLAPLGQRPEPRQIELEKPVLSSSASATNTRIPPLGSNFKFIVRNRNVNTVRTEIDQRHVKFNMVKSATSSRYPLSPTKNSIILPSLSSLDARERTGTITRGSRKESFNSQIVGRSISAAITQKNSSKLNGNGHTPKVNIIHYH
ncbi:uncharacterized protein LOC129763002 [Toxorhynchites rutilus septentrionalis]|uniref:uncharacterized protein LOC129763002 n=1 Tax=Toxorhynchites rutilus septentrionalis TaxID=329112 RepID=UPI002478790A|nr:uncharacterized protein LOC129763002 [Toxorhynchites rutilus septentrionalis]